MNGAKLQADVENITFLQLVSIWCEQKVGRAIRV